MNVFPLMTVTVNATARARRRHAAAPFWIALGALFALGGLLAVRPAAAQNPAEATAETRTPTELQELVGPIALYPDDLVAIVLPASTYPLQVVQAARLLEQRKIDGSLQPDASWDDSVVALLNYPEVVKLMNDDLDWTWDLGQAVINQNTDVLDAIQGFRDRAYAAGNLRSDERQVVTAANEEITIAPADPKVIYVPYYEPERVVVYQSVPVYRYYPWAYPVYYYPYPVGYHFHTGFFWGVTTAFVIGWHSHHVHAYPYGYYGHPYYGHHYYDSYYVRNVYVNANNGNHVWYPGYRRNGRPFTRSEEGYVADRNQVVGSGSTDGARANSRGYRPEVSPSDRGGLGGAAATRRSIEGDAPQQDATADAATQQGNAATASRTRPTDRTTGYRGGLGGAAASRQSAFERVAPQQDGSAGAATEQPGLTVVPRTRPTDRIYRGGLGGAATTMQNRSIAQPPPSERAAPTQGNVAIAPRTRPTDRIYRGGLGGAATTMQNRSIAQPPPNPRPSVAQPPPSAQQQSAPRGDNGGGRSAPASRGSGGGEYRGGSGGATRGQQGSR